MTIGKTPWPHLLADLKAKREALDQMIGLIDTHFVGDDPDAMPDSSPNDKRAVKHRPTDRPTEQSTRQPDNARRPP